MRRIEKTIEKLRKQLDESQALIDRLKKSEAKCRSTEAALRESERKPGSVYYTHLRAHETVLDLVCRLLLA